MKLQLITLITIIFFLSCNENIQKNRSSYNSTENKQPAEKLSFEGVVKYSVETETKIKDKYSDYRSQKYGDKMDFYWSRNGSQMRKSSGNSTGLEYSIYNKEENLSYTKFRNIDTLYYYDSGEILDRIIEIRNGPEEKILNQICKSLVFDIESSFQKDTIQMIYFYSGIPYIDQALFTEMKDGFADILYHRTESPFMKMILDYNTHTLTYTALEIIEKNIDKKTFKISEELPKVKY